MKKLLEKIDKYLGEYTDRYDMMDSPIDHVNNVLLPKIISKLKSTGIKVVDYSDADYDQDAQIKFENDFGLQVTTKKRPSFVLTQYASGKLEIVLDTKSIDDVIRKLKAVNSPNMILIPLSNRIRR